MGIHYRESPRHAGATAAGYPGASDCWRHTLRARKGRSPLSSKQHKVHIREFAGNFHSATRIFATPDTHIFRWQRNVISSLNTRYFLSVTWPFILQSGNEVLTVSPAFHIVLQFCSLNNGWSNRMQFTHKFIKFWYIPYIISCPCNTRFLGNRGSLNVHVFTLVCSLIRESGRRSRYNEWATG